MARDEDKRAAALAAVKYVESGMTVGLGTGSTARFAIEEIGRRVKEEGITVRGVPTSMESENLARRLGISLPPLTEVDRIDLTIDGADEIDPKLRLIKGGGGALLREKIVAASSDRMIVVADRGKLVKILGAFPLPVEIALFGWNLTARKIEALGAPVTLRMNGANPFVTDGGNYVLDCRFGRIENAERLAAELSAIPGVAGHGLFIGLASLAVVAEEGKATVLNSFE
jgi:ribose 5-phosphate isomerase A